LTRAATLVVLFLMLPSAAFAARTLSEPKAIKSAARKASKAKSAAAWKAEGLTERCDGAAAKARDLRGMACRLAVFGQQEKARSLASARDVKARADGARAAWAAATSIEAYKPLTRSPSFGGDRFVAHQQACSVVLGAYDALHGLPKTADPALRAKSSAAIAGFEKDTTLQKAACSCTSSTLSMAQTAGASLKETGALQTVLTSRGCGLDESKLKTERGGPKAKFSGDAARVAADSTIEAQMRQYAATKDITLDRCRLKYLVRERVTDVKKMEKCACGEFKRWRFPAQKGRPEVDVLLPLAGDRLGVRVKVSAPGKVTSCGPLEGPATGAK
jgi:hypothetical protein